MKTVVTTTLWHLDQVDDEIILLDANAESFYVDMTESTDDGTWETKEDWYKFKRELNEDFDMTIKKFLFGKNLESKSIKYDNFTFSLIEEKIKVPSYQDLRIVFDEPVLSTFGKIGLDNEKHITATIQEIIGNMSYEFFTRGEGEGIEIKLQDIIIIK